MIEACFYEPGAARIKADLLDVKRRLRRRRALARHRAPCLSRPRERKREFLAAMRALGAAACARSPSTIGAIRSHAISTAIPEGLAEMESVHDVPRARSSRSPARPAASARRSAAISATRRADRRDRSPRNGRRLRRRPRRKRAIADRGGGRRRRRSRRGRGAPSRDLARRARRQSTSSSTTPASRTIRLSPRPIRQAGATTSTAISTAPTTAPTPCWPA